MEITTYTDNNPPQETVIDLPNGYKLIMSGELTPGNFIVISQDEKNRLVAVQDENYRLHDRLRELEEEIRVLRGEQ